jgi:hypothetical protein
MLEIDLWRVHDGRNVSSLNISGHTADGEPGWNMVAGEFDAGRAVDLLGLGGLIFWGSS